MKAILRSLGLSVWASRGLSGDAPPGAGALPPGLAIFSAGLVLGGLIAAAMGLDLFPGAARSGGAALESSQRARLGGLEQELAMLRSEAQLVARERDETQKENAELRRRLGIEIAAPAPSAQRPSAAELAKLLEGEPSGPRAASALAGLLESGPAGRAVIQEALEMALRQGRPLFADPASAMGLLKVVSLHEKEVAALLFETLSAGRWRDEPILAERFLEWASWFFANARPELAESPAYYATLVQTLTKLLEEGAAPLWTVLRSLDRLGYFPADSISRLLESPERSDAQPVVLRFLGEHRGPESIELLARYLRLAGSGGGWRAELALDMLAGRPEEAARRALSGFLGAEDAELRLAAHRALLARPGAEAAPAAQVELLANFVDQDPAPAAGKLRLLNRVRLENPALLQALCARPAGKGLRDAALQAELCNSLVAERENR